MSQKKEMSEQERALRRKHKTDFLYYAPRALRIRTKAGEILPFSLNTAQLYIHSRIEAQIARTGRVRVLILKGRQQGCSTYTEGRFFWKVTHHRGRSAYILTHEDPATKNLFDMAKRYYDTVPKALRPSAKTENAKELWFDQLDSGYKVGTAGSKGTGRSQTLQYFHGSEVAYWPNGDTHLSGVLQAVADLPGTEIILESTANGNEGMFFDMCMDAQREVGDYELIFVPWFWQEEYRKDLPRRWKRTSEEDQYAATHGVNDEQLAWRRAKINELRGVHNFRREYPATVEEAFKAEVEGALWRRELIDETRLHDRRLKYKRIVVAIDPSGGKNRKNDPKGKRKHDEVGIVVAGQAYDGDVDILEDASGNMSPIEWGSKAVALYQKWKADRIVAEKNYGGEMVEHTIRSVDKKVPYKGVDATRGKEIRAEPISAEMEQGRVHHVGTFIALEDEMCTWKPGDPSPNRLDAMVWAVTELIGGRKLIPVKPFSGGLSSPYGPGA